MSNPAGFFRRFSIVNTLLVYGVYIFYVLLFFGIAALSPQFLSPPNLLQLLIHASAVMIVCAGNVFVLLTAGIDMSVGSTAFLSSAVGAYVLTRLAINPYLVILLMVLIGVFVGILNGVIVRRYNIYPLITTLGVLFAGRGIGQYLIQDGVSVFPAQIRFFGTGRIVGIPVPVCLAFLFLTIGQFLLTRTSLGRQFVAIGDNEQAARKSGVRVGRVKFIAYVISGFCSAVAGLIISARVSSVYPNTAHNLEFTVLVALVVGGVSLFGAKGSVFPGAFIGALFLSTLFNGLVVMNASPYLFAVLQGLLVFIAILVSTAKTRLGVVSAFSDAE